MPQKPKWLPSCLPDGSYAPKQCKGERQNGRYNNLNNFGERQCTMTVVFFLPDVTVIAQMGIEFLVKNGLTKLKI